MTQRWIRAFRPRTLPLTFASIGLGSMIAAGMGLFRWEVFLLSLSTALLLQLLSNLANDYGDSVHGADNISRIGPSRAVQSGEISKRQMKVAVIVFGILSFVSGSMLLFLSLSDIYLLIVFFFLGVAAIWAAIRYTTGSRPYGYSGFGDPSVFFFFGLVGVGGSFYLHGEYWDPLILLPASGLGLLAVSVLNVNNIRDIDSDRDADKYSIPVRLGKKGGVVYHWLLILTALSASIIYALRPPDQWYEWAFLILIPFWVEQSLGLWRKEPQQLDPYLRKSALTTLSYALLFGLGQWITLAS